MASRWQRFEKSADAYVTVTGALLLLIVMPILTAGLEQIENVLTVAMVGIAATISMAASKAPRWAIHLSWMAPLVIYVGVLLPGEHRELSIILGAALAALLISTPVVIIRRVGRHVVITPTTMWGAIAAYLALGMAFSLMYAAVYAANQDAFSNVHDGNLGNFNYFSFVTMTTLGYGDIAPVTDLPRAMSVLQTLVGQIYLVVVVARVVSLLGRSRTTETSSDSVGIALARSDQNGPEGDDGADEGGQ